jgi:hypothetical protein
MRESVVMLGGYIHSMLPTYQLQISILAWLNYYALLYWQFSGNILVSEF